MNQAPDEGRESEPSFLIGTWAIDRTIVNRATATRGTFLGTLTVTQDGDHFNWHEAGKLVWNARELPAPRTLSIRRIDGEWWVTFADGSRFHRWLVGEKVFHPCAEDTYCGLIERVSPGQLNVTWDVTGPTENQLICSRLARVSQW